MPPPSPPDPGERDEESPGWNAITQALTVPYGNQEPLHYATALKASLGGPDPLDGISVYKSDAPSAHWHYVSYGLTELHRKESENREVSGFGFEFTFRLTRQPGAAQPPPWPANLLQNLARYVFGTGNVFDVGHHMTLNGPIALDEPTDIVAIAFAADPQLPGRNTPHGKMKFLQIVGLTIDEYDAIKGWDTTKLLGVLARDNPMMITDLRRPSMLKDPATAHLIREGSERDGSSCDSVYLKVVKWSREAGGKTLEVRLGAIGVSDVLHLLKGRIEHGRNFLLVGDEGAVLFEPASDPGISEEGGMLKIRVSPGLAAEMRNLLAPRRGVYSWPALPGLTVKVDPTEITNADGQIVRVVG